MPIELTGTPTGFGLTGQDPPAQIVSVPADAEAYVFVWHLWGWAGLELTELTLGGVGATHYESTPVSQAGDDGCGVAFGLVGSNTGSQPLDWEYEYGDAAIGSGPSAGVVWLKGLDIDNPIRSSESQVFPDGGPCSIELATEPGDIVVGMLGVIGTEHEGDPDPQSDQTVALANFRHNFHAISISWKPASEGSTTVFYGSGDPEEAFPGVSLAAIALRPRSGTPIEVTRAMVLEALAGLATERAMPVEVLARLDLERSAPFEALAGKIGGAGTGAAAATIGEGAGAVLAEAEGAGAIGAATGTGGSSVQVTAAGKAASSVDAIGTGSVPIVGIGAATASIDTTGAGSTIVSGVGVAATAAAIGEGVGQAGSLVIGVGTGGVASAFGEGSGSVQVTAASATELPAGVGEGSGAVQVTGAGVAGLGSVSSGAGQTIISGAGSASTATIEGIGGAVVSDGIITLVGAGSRSGTTSASPSVNSIEGIQAGDLIIISISVKPSNPDRNPFPPVVSGFSRVAYRYGSNQPGDIGTDNDTGGYGTTTGSNLGNVSVAFYAKIAEGDEPTTSIPFPLDFDTFPEAPSGSVLSSKLLVFRKTSGAWFLNGTAANDKIGGDISLVFDSDPGVQAGDVVVAAIAVASFDFDSIGSYALSQNGVTFDTITEIDQFRNPLGWRLGGFLITAPVLAGDSSGAPTLTASVTGTSTDVRGPGLFLRIAANNGGAGAGAALTTATGAGSVLVQADGAGQSSQIGTSSGQVTVSGGGGGAASFTSVGLAFVNPAIGSGGGASDAFAGVGAAATITSGAGKGEAAFQALGGAELLGHPSLAPSLGGFGYGWGAVPWGFSFFAATEAPPPPDEFDIFCFFASSMVNVLVSSDANVIDAGGQFSPGQLGDLVVGSGGGSYSTANAILEINTSVPESWTLQFAVKAVSLPNDFSSLVSNHVFVGTTDGAGACAGVFISKVGVVYTGGVSHSVSGDLQIDGPLALLPDSINYVQTDDYVVFRIAADYQAGVVYIYITAASDIPFMGHQLRYVMPVIKAEDLANPPFDRTLISVRGSIVDASVVNFDQLCLADGLLIPNLAPVADAGRDQAARLCSLVRLDGSGSADPEGQPLFYSWRLVDAPLTSSFAFAGYDGATVPTAPPTGLAEKFYSVEAAAAHAQDPFENGDVLLVDEQPYSITGTGVDGTGFHFILTSPILPDNLSSKSFKLLRQRSISGKTTAKPTFFPDIPGIYKFDLIVSDGLALSPLSTTIVNVLESPIPRGCAPDLSFIWSYLSDFWGLVEDRERLGVFFESMAQVAASELLTLWQIDYSKSLRDVQRTIQRRWLHYDLLLAEPLPELTRIRQIRGGVESVFFPGGQLAGIAGTKLVVSSPALEKDLTVVFASPNPYTAQQFSEELNRRISFLDARFRTQLIQGHASGDIVRLDASIPFTISSETTCPVFVNGSSNQHLHGAGIRVGTRSYKVDRSLVGLGLKEGDVITIDGEGYSILRIADDPADEYRFQRVLVKRDVPLLLGSTWSISAYVDSRLLNFYAGLVTEGDIATFEVTEVNARSSQLLPAPVKGVPSSAPSRLAVDLDAIDVYVSQPERYTVRLAKVNRKNYVPVDALVVDVPCLQEFIKPASDAEVLRRNVDYFIDTFRGQPCIKFVSEAGGPDVWEGNLPPDRLWAETTYIDNSLAIEANFGTPVEFTLEDAAQVSHNFDYLSAVKGLWYAYLNGPTISNLRIGTQILLGLPFAEEAGVIEEIRHEFSPSQGRILIRDKASSAVVRSYSYPRALSLETNPETGRPYQVGDEVSQFAPLVRGAEVLDWVNTPDWFEGYLNQGSFLEIEKFFKFLVRIDSEAFSLTALSFVQSLILRIKPTITYPLFVIRQAVAAAEVSVDDQVSIQGTLYLFDGGCTDFVKQGIGSTMFDDPNPSGGGWFNQFDGNNDPHDAPVVDQYPVPQPVSWGFDKNYLCPEDSITGWILAEHLGGVPEDANPPINANFDNGAHPVFVGEDTNVTALSTTQTIFHSTVSSSVAGVIEAVWLVIHGDPGGDPTDYELCLNVNGVTAEVIPFNVTDTGIVALLPTSGLTSVVATQPFSVGIRTTSGSRNPNWASVYVMAVLESVPFTYDQSMPSAIYAVPFTFQ